MPGGDVSRAPSGARSAPHAVHGSPRQGGSAAPVGPELAAWTRGRYNRPVAPGRCPRHAWMRVPSPFGGCRDEVDRDDGRSAGLVLAAAPAFADAGPSKPPRPGRAAARRLVGAVGSRDPVVGGRATSRRPQADATLVGGPGSRRLRRRLLDPRRFASSLKINLTLQTRYEYFDWDDRCRRGLSPGGDLSGFSLPRVTLKFSGDATCDVHYYAELEFGHARSRRFDQRAARPHRPDGVSSARASDRRPDPGRRGCDFGIAREAWIEYERGAAFAFRMGLDQDADHAPADDARPRCSSSSTSRWPRPSPGRLMPGYTDRNRDYGFMVHGALGCDGEFQYMVTVTNGDGPVHRNVLDGSTDDPLALRRARELGHRGPHGLRGGRAAPALVRVVRRGRRVGALLRRPLAREPAGRRLTSDRIALGRRRGRRLGRLLVDGRVQRHEPRGRRRRASTASATSSRSASCSPTRRGRSRRATAPTSSTRAGPARTFSGNEIAAAVNYYIDGHADKVTLDVAFISTDDFNLLFDVYAGYNATGDERRDPAAPAVAARALTPSIAQMLRTSGGHKAAGRSHCRGSDGARPRPTEPPLAVHPLRGSIRGRWERPAMSGAHAAEVRSPWCIASRAPAAPRRTSSCGTDARTPARVHGAASARRPSGPRLPRGLSRGRWERLPRGRAACATRRLLWCTAPRAPAAPRRRPTWAPPRWGPPVACQPCRKALNPIQPPPVRADPFGTLGCASPACREGS